MTVWQRVLVEKRAIIVALAVGLIANVAAYAFVVYPLEVKAAGAADRAQSAATSSRAAERDLESARALIAGKTRSDRELSTFYGTVLPRTQADAVRLTYLPLPTIARNARVRVLARRFEKEAPRKDARVIRLRIFAALQGDYESLRRFIYDLETAPEFVIIDDVTLTQSDPGKPLNLSLELSTYFTRDAHAE